MPKVRTIPAPTPPECPDSLQANAAPGGSCHFATPTRRAWLAGGLAATLFARAARASETLNAVPLAGAGMGYEGASPGRPLRGRPGELLQLTLTNALDAPTSFALLGLRSEDGPGFVGLGGAPLASGSRREIAFRPREPGFGLYGPYGPGAARQWGEGLFGAIVIDETAPPPVDLDAVVVLSGDDTAPLRFNGAPELTLSAAPGARVRLRLANAAPDLTLTLAADVAVQIVAIDGQPCEAFAPAGGAFPLCPSARFELMFDLGETPTTFAAQGAQRPALRIVPSGARVRARPPVAALPANPRLPREIALERAQRVSVLLTGAGPYQLNGVGGADWPLKPLFQAKRGAPVTLALTNQTPTAQTLRLEGHVARQLHALDDGWDPYWRDAFYLGPGRTLHVAFVADIAGKWPLASASPRRREQGLAAWFQVV